MRPHRPLAARVLGLLGAAALLAALTGCTDPDGDDPPSTETTTTTAGESPTTDETTSASEDPSDDAGSDEPTSGGTGEAESGTVPTAEVGTCLSIADLLTSNGGVTDLPPVDCSEPHDGQVFAVVTMDDGDFPGEDALLIAVTSECEAAFEGFIGTAAGESALEFDGLSPTEQTWAVGDREIICLAYYPDLRTATQSWEGSGI